MTDAGDVLVIGAGPAGLAAAIRAAAAGAAVRVVDRADAAGAKPCGGCLNERALRALEALGVRARLDAAGAVPLRRVELIARGRARTLAIGGSMVLSRARLDALLADRAAALGVEIRRGASATVEATGPSPRVRVHARGPGTVEMLAPRVVVVADGLAGSAWSPPQGPARRGRGRAARIGVAAVLADGAGLPDGVVRMAIARSGYVGFVRLEDGRIDCAAAVDPRGVREAGHPAALVRRVLVAAGAPVPADLETARWRGTGRLEGRRVRVAAPGVLVAGDAAHDAEPFTGDGIGAALLGGLAAGAQAALVAARGWRIDDERTWTATVRAQRRARRANRAAARLLRAPRCASAAFALAAAWPTLARGALSGLGRPAEGTA